MSNPDIKNTSSKKPDQNKFKENEVFSTEKYRRKGIEKLHQSQSEMIENLILLTGKKKKEKVKNKLKYPSYVKENLKGIQSFQNYFNKCVERAGYTTAELLNGSISDKIRLKNIWKNAAKYWSKNHPDLTLRNKTKTFNDIENWDPMRKK